MNGTLKDFNDSFADIYHPDARLEGGEWVCWIQFIDLLWESAWMEANGWKPVNSVGPCLTKFEAPSEEAAHGYNRERALREFHSLPSI